MAARTPIPLESSATPSPDRVVPYDFRHTDRVPAAQLRSVRAVHQDLARGLGGSLSAYLRTMASLAVAQIDQLSFSEFSRRAAQPATSFTLRMRPQEGRAILQISHAALFPMLEILLGGNGKSPVSIDRHITEIERIVFNPILRIFVQELKSAWQSVSPIEFALDGEETTRQYLSSLPSGQELLAVHFELKVGEMAGTLSVSLPSRAVRAILQVAAPAQPEAPAEEPARIMRLIQGAQLSADVRLNGPKMLLQDLLNMESGDVLKFDHPLAKEVELELNGTSKFQGHIVTSGKKRAFQVKRPIVGENEAT
jgi:flagellar motor switch protein FliM